MGHGLRAVLVGTMGMLLAVGAGRGGAEAADIGELNTGAIVVRTYTPPHLRNDIHIARRTASAILERARIDIDWLECGLPANLKESSACSRPADPNELIVRLVSGTTVDRRPGVSTLGYAFVDLGAGGGALATIFADRVRGMAQGAAVGVAELLGKTMAHEIGHLLLGTNQHSAHGLMRAYWSNADLRRNRATEWLFDSREGEVMRQGIASRLRLPAGGSPSPITRRLETAWSVSPLQRDDDAIPDRDH